MQDPVAQWVVHQTPGWGGLCVRSGEVNSHIKFVILLTVNNTNLKILVQRIYY